MANEAADGQPPAQNRVEVLGNIGPNWFASVMGTGIVAAAGAGLPIHVVGLRAFAEVVWVLAAVLLAVLDADLPEGAHSVRDPRVRMTLTALEHLFAGEFPINHRLPAGRAPALGRSRSDRYFGRGAWYPTTLAAAAICYRLAQYPGHDSAGLIAHGDGFMATVRAITPADGALSEQVDRTTGAQTSARHLTWSYAAFVSAARLRAEALI